MKTYYKTTRIFIFLLIIVQFSCEDLPILEDCNIDTGIIIEDDIFEPLPRTMTFRVKNPELLPEGPRVTWKLSRENVNIDLGADASKLEFDYEVHEGGNYQIILDIVFDYQGCDVSLSESFTLDVDLPIPIINPSATECIVGECDLIFTNGSSNADTWTWTLPGDNADYEMEDQVTVNLNMCPGTFLVILTATNFSGSVSDTAVVTVNPVTFDETHEIGPGSFERVMCVEEAADGSFFIIGNTNEESYLAHVSRNGEDLISSFLLPQGLTDGYNTRRILACQKVGNRNVLIGRVRYEDDTNDVYLLVVDSEFSDGFEKAIFHPDNDEEIGRDIVETNDGGYLVCGSKSTGAQKGMLFLELNASFDRIGAKVHYPSNSSHIATGIEKISNGYMVVGQKRNPGTNSIEGCSFRLDQNYNTVEGSEAYYGNFIPNELVKIDDDSFVMIGQEGVTAKIIAFGGNSWTFPLGLAELTKGMLIEDGSLIVVGSILISGDNAPVAIKINTNTGSGEVFKFPKPGFIRSFYALDETKENGFIFGGFSFSSEDKMLMIRTNKQIDIPN